MMDWYGHDWSWGGWLAMVIAAVVFWVAVAWVVLTLVRRPSEPRRRPEDVLADRFARGEIDEEEFRSRREVLRSDR